ncbi:MAG: type II toxin-antitoxin system prevent-host-death family antitoxin, partial [bacterium]
ERGECVTITRHGKPIATLRAVESPRRRSPEELIAAFRDFRAKHPLGDLDVKELIEEGRKY